MTEQREKARRTARRAVVRAKHSEGDPVAWVLARDAQRHEQQTLAYAPKGWVKA
jgi:hypothetical protein